MAKSPLENPLENGQPRRPSAWIASCGIHGVLLVVAALLIRGPRPSKGLPGDADRPVSVVLKTTNASNETTYLTESNELQKEAQPNDQTSQDVFQQPSESQPLSIPASELPKATNLSPNGVNSSSDLTNNKMSNPLQSNSDLEKMLAQERALQAAKRATGPTASMSLFGGSPTTGRSFVFVIDRSSSMGEDGLGALAAAGEELFRAVGGLEEVHKFQIIAYHHRQVLFDRAKMVSASDQNQQKVRTFFGGLAAFGGTDHAMALRAALRFKPDVVYLLTDGGHPGISPQKRAEIKKLAGRGTTIHCVQFGLNDGPDPDDFMRPFSQQMGGSYTYIRMSELRK